MTTTVTGRVVGEQNEPLEGLRVTPVGDWYLTTERLAESSTSKPDGRFTLQIEAVSANPPPSLSFSLRVTNMIGRPVAPDKAVVAPTSATHDVGDVKVLAADRTGLAVTNLTGVVKFVRPGNAVELLIDGDEAFGKIAEDIKGAQESVEITQLFFSLPEEFEPLPENEKPALMFNFAKPLVEHDPLRPNQPPAQRTQGDRPERLLISRAIANRTVRILLNQPTAGWPEAFFWLAVLTPLAAGLGVGGAAAFALWVGVGIPFFPLVLAATVVAFFAEFILVKKTLEKGNDVDEAKIYFGQLPSSVPPITVRGFEQPAPQNGVLHCKMVITDRKRAVVVGSPFSQRYFDDPKHKIRDPRRGRNTSDMVHDMSISVVGPAVHDLYEAFRLFWNEDLEQAAKLAEGPVPDAEPPGDDVATVQVVRTLSQKRFSVLGGTSEKGILEGYLRAIAEAKKYIYIETQYFTDSVITDALIAALKANDKLELILLVPIKPDVIFYPRRQAWRIEQLRKAAASRVGVFTRWSYLHGPVRPFIAPVYIHSKLAVIDDSWVTVGSANLDGLSLDYNLLLSPLTFGETMAAELNVNVLPSAPGEVTPFAEFARRRIFAEHLGLLDPEGDPDPDHPSLDGTPTTSWLALWKTRAAVALQHVKEGRQQPLPGFVLEYPAKDGGWLDTPRKHLAALGVPLRIGQEAVRPLKSLRQFHFDTGKWDKVPELDDVDLT